MFAARDRGRRYQKNKKGQKEADRLENKGKKNSRRIRRSEIREEQR